jgi:hypothetical protein
LIISKKKNIPKVNLHKYFSRETNRKNFPALISKLALISKEKWSDINVKFARDIFQLPAV